jgi:general secretion pathway protein A
VPASTPAPRAITTLPEFLAAQPASDGAAWQVLAQSWQASLAAGAPDPCAALAGEGLRCYRSRRASLSLLRQIDRPVLVTLQPAGGQAGVAAVLQRLEGPSGAQVALLAGAGGTALRVPVVELAPLWRGEIATLWKAPANLPAGDDVAATAAGGHWLDQQLKRAGVAGATRRERLHQFQLSQGLTPDGQAGPLTLMLLGRAVGVQEPRLY